MNPSTVLRHRLGCVLLLLLLLHLPLLLWTDSSWGASAMSGPGSGAGDGAVTLLDIRLDPPPAAIPAGPAPPEAAPRPLAKPPAAPAAVATAGGGGRGGYLAQVRARLERARRTIDHAVTGEVVLLFEVRPDGQVAEASLERGSGDPRLDTEALALLQRAGPLPPPPGGRTVQLSVPLVFGRGGD